MPQLLSNTDFNVQHSPFGAFASFTLGRQGQGGGFGLELPGPANQDVYIGLARPGQGITLLPFFTGAETLTADNPNTPVQVFPSSQISRSLNWASDTWQAQNLTFTLLSPFGRVPDPTDANTGTVLGDGQLRFYLLPAIFAELTVNNSDSDETAFAFFGLGASDPLRPLSETKRLTGIARAGEYGFAVVPTSGNTAVEVLSWNLLDELARAETQNHPGREVSLPQHRLANRGGIRLTIGPRETRTYTLVLGFYRGGVVTSGIPTTYLYTRLFPDLEAVLEYGIEWVAEYRKRAAQQDEELELASLTAERKFLVAQATHSYFGSTMLLHDEKAMLPRSATLSAASLHRPVWVVNEGEYRMLNTLDLTLDQAFFELRHHPWTLRNTLDLFAHRYGYTDEVQDATDPARPRFPGGQAFAHDMGVANQFTPPGHSAYEQPDMNACFAYMTQEALCNWCLCAALYGLPTIFTDGDLLWLATRRHVLHTCLESLMRRDAPETLRNGIMSFDSARCGQGQEITTYDSLDPALGQARSSVYLAVKTWATYLGLSRCFDVLGEDDTAVEAEEQAARAAITISAHWNEEGEYFPANFESENPGYASRILPAIEGLIYPYLWGDEDAVSAFGPYGQLIALLRRHFKAALIPGVCVDAESGGLKISSTSDNTALSKIFLLQFVAEQVLGLPLLEEYDIVHARWLREGHCRNFAFTDQVRTTDGHDLGCRYYPRAVTNLLWTL